jgi:streptomycin 6-kinase
LVSGAGALLSAHTSVQETAIWEWGFLERVSSGLCCLDLGIEELGWPFLQSAEMLSAEQI